jgi:hypothetical protein
MYTASLLERVSRQLEGMRFHSEQSWPCLADHLPLSLSPDPVFKKT